MVFFLKLLFRKLRGKRSRSVVFYRHSYYHFYYLAQALRKRGWDAIVVNLEPKDGPNANYYHDEDINLYDPNPERYKQNISIFFKKAKRRFTLMHFAGDGCLSFFPENFNEDEPWDIIEWKEKNKIAYSVSGCNSGTSQSSVNSWSLQDNALSVCDRCILQDNETMCNDTKNLSWGEKVHRYCDLIFSETLPALDYMKKNKKVVREPTTMCLDPTFWSNNLVIPDEHMIPRQPGELLIYHSVGNYESRNTVTKNFKGTPFIIKAIERLKQEGFKLKLIFITNQPNKIIRFYQAQADIIIDQLNYGRYGATAREGMMLGKPVICYMTQFEYDEEDRLSCLEECPLVSASELEIYDVLRDLVLDSEKRKSLGEQGRAYALKWHSADACAHRYETYYDALFEKET